MHYFAYGSNMSLARLRGRVPGAQPLGCFTLKAHDLRFHKSGKDGSAKCDAYFTPGTADSIYGVVFRIDPAEKPYLDAAEGLGRGYDQKDVTVVDRHGLSVNAITYFATRIDTNLRPYSWYVNHVLIGAREASLPLEYIEAKIASVQSIEDSDQARDAAQRAIHG